MLTKLIPSFGAITFFLSWAGLISGQTAELIFNKKDLVDVLPKIEQTTTLTFNFDPALLSKYTFSGTLNLDDQQSFLSKLFYQTPFEFELSGTNVLISPTSQTSIFNLWNYD